MDVKFLQRNFFQRLFGIPVTSKPQDPACWKYSDGRLSIDLDRTPELSKPFGAIRLEGGNLPHRILVITDENGEHRAFKNRCTHLGHRRLDPVPGTATVQCCSVNKSTYDYNGKKVFGPAPQDIQSFTVDKEGDSLIVHLTG